MSTVCDCTKITLHAEQEQSGMTMSTKNTELRNAMNPSSLCFALLAFGDLCLRRKDAAEILLHASRGCVGTLLDQCGNDLMGSSSSPGGQDHGRLAIGRLHVGFGACTDQCTHSLEITAGCEV